MLRRYGTMAAEVWYVFLPIPNKSCFKLFWVVGWVVAISIQEYLFVNKRKLKLSLNLFQCLSLANIFGIIQMEFYLN